MVNVVGIHAVNVVGIHAVEWDKCMTYKRVEHSKRAIRSSKSKTKILWAMSFDSIHSFCLFHLCLLPIKSVSPIPTNYNVYLLDTIIYVQVCVWLKTNK